MRKKSVPAKHRVTWKKALTGALQALRSPSRALTKTWLEQSSKKQRSKNLLPRNGWRGGYWFLCKLRYLSVRSFQRLMQREGTCAHPARMVGPSTYEVPLTLQGEHEPHRWGLGYPFGTGNMDSISAINSCLIWIYKTYKLLHYWAVKPSKDLNGQMPSGPVRAWGLGCPLPCFIWPQCLHIRWSQRFQALQWSFLIPIFYLKKLKLKDE